MEAARSDFTPLARRFQVELLARAFADAGEAEVRDFCRDLVARLQRGELDAELVYRKSLRRPAEDYGSETPQVRAARLLGWTGERGRISYVMTRAGAEPVEARTRRAARLRGTTSSASSCPSPAPSPTRGAGTRARGSARRPQLGLFAS